MMTGETRLGGREYIDVLGFVYGPREPLHKAVFIRKKNKDFFRRFSAQRSRYIKIYLIIWDWIFNRGDRLNVRETQKQPAEKRKENKQNR